MILTLLPLIISRNRRRSTKTRIIITLFIVGSKLPYFNVNLHNLITLLREEDCYEGRYKTFYRSSKFNIEFPLGQWPHLFKARKILRFVQYQPSMVPRMTLKFKIVLIILLSLDPTQISRST